MLSHTKMLFSLADQCQKFAKTIVQSIDLRKARTLISAVPELLSTNQAVSARLLLLSTTTTQHNQDTRDDLILQILLQHHHRTAVLIHVTATEVRNSYVDYEMMVF